MSIISMAYALIILACLLKAVAYTLLLIGH
jgi:hypothetical protein